MEKQASNHPILYKYRDWNNPYHKRILLENRAFFAAPNSFEDIKDCNVPENFPPLSKLYDLFLERSKKDNSNYSRAEHRKYARYWSKHSPLANPTKLKNEVKIYNDLFFNSRFGILSLTANSENDIMWEKYGNMHTGFCIGFNADILFNVVAGGGGNVLYVDDLPIIDFIKDDFREKHIKNTFYKEKKWEFEQEYRLHKTWKRTISDVERNIEFPINCIVEIILGKNMSEPYKQEIKDIMKSKYPHAKIKELIS